MKQPFSLEENNSSFASIVSRSDYLAVKSKEANHRAWVSWAEVYNYPRDIGGEEKEVVI